MYDEYGPTDLTVGLGSPGGCPDEDWDVCVFDSDYGDNGFNGWNQCAGDTSGAHPNRRCSLGFVKINLYFSPPAKRIACHELGHSIGLRHSGNDASCMKTTQDGGSSARLANHDVGHVDDEY